MKAMVQWEVIEGFQKKGRGDKMYRNVQRMTFSWLSTLSKLD